jgi:hypothetical protein
VQPAVESEPQGPHLVLILPRGDVVQWALLSERQGRAQDEECDQTSDSCFIKPYHCASHPNLRPSLPIRATM